MIWGNGFLAVGSGVTLAGVVDTSSVVFLVGSVVAGIGFGLGFLGSFRHLTALASLDRRSALVSSIYIASYTAFSLPVIAAGIAVEHFGLRDVAIVYGAAIAALAALATVAELIFDRGETAASGLTRNRFAAKCRPGGTHYPATPSVVVAIPRLHVRGYAPSALTTSPSWGDREADRDQVPTGRGTNQ
jgi:MFS family permease